jgi:putative spermidine/putrescine transport system substrate-binding protein
LRKKSGFAAVLALTVIGLAACGSDGGGTATQTPLAAPTGAAPAFPTEDATLTFVSWGGTLQDAFTKNWLDPFSKEHGNVTIVSQSPPEAAKIKAQQDAKQVTWDVVDQGLADFDMAKTFEPVDCRIVKCDEIDPKLKIDNGVPFYTYANPILYSTKDFGGAVPQGWADYFDFQKFPGKRALAQSSAGLVEKLLLADGVKPEELYPLDIERAFKFLDKIKDNVIFWQAASNCKALITSGEVNMADCASGNQRELIEDEKLPFATQWNQAIPSQTYLTVPIGSKNSVAAWNLIQYITSAEKGALLGTFRPYAPGNVKAQANMPTTYKGWYPTEHADQILQGYNKDSWHEKNGVELNERIQSWLAGG